MVNLLFAAEATATAPPGDEFQTLAYAFLGLTMLVAAIATVIITPKMEKH